MSDAKYLVIGGTVPSKNDDQTHFIPAIKLVELYRVDPKECILIHDGRDKSMLLGMDISKLIILRPQPSGDYSTLPTEKGDNVAERIS